MCAADRRINKNWCWEEFSDDGHVVQFFQEIFWMLIPDIALYRLVELTSGSIVIDGVDVSTIGLTDLRKAMAIIPQDPVSIPYCYLCF
jgi:hypothetical protein